MNLSARRELCLSFPGATEQVQWTDNLVFKVGGKMFLVSGMEAGSRYSFKCDEESFYELTELPGIIPAPYLARAKWVQIHPAACQLQLEELSGLIRTSYDLVFAKLPKGVQKEIESKEASD